MSSIAVSPTSVSQSPSSSSAPAPSGQSSATSRSEQQAALARLLRTYQNDLKQGQTAANLKGLAKQITDAGKALGQNVTLPTAPATSGASSSDGAAASTATSKLSVTA